MLPSVPVPPRPLQDYLEVVGEAAVENLQAAARALSGARILNLNSTAFGGGVAELLVTQVGLLNELGLDAHWQVINGTSEFSWNNEPNQKSPWLALVAGQKYYIEVLHKAGKLDDARTDTRFAR